MRKTALIAAALLAGCGSSKDAGSTSKSDAPRPFAVEGGAEASRVAPGQRSAAAVFSLLPDGLMVTRGGADTPVTLLRFGEPQTAVIAALRKELGQPRESDNGQCEHGAMHFADFGAIKANFADGKFVGWLTESGKGLRTGDGISPAMTFKQLEKFGAKRVLESTLDGEFDLTRPGGGGTMGGFADPAGKVKSLYAGANCFFR